MSEKSNGNGELIGRYREVEQQIQAEQDNLAGLQQELAQAQAGHNDAVVAIEARERTLASSSLTKIVEIKKVRDAIQRAKDDEKAYRLIVDNLTLAVKNAKTSIQKLQTQRAETEKKLWREHSITVMNEIENLLGDRIEQFYLAATLSSPGCQPFNLGFPDRLNRFMGRADERAELRSKLLPKIING